MSPRLEDQIVQVFKKDPVEAVDMVSRALRRARVYISHGDDEELGYGARLGVWHKQPGLCSPDIWRWTMSLGDTQLLYWRSDSDDEEYPVAVEDGDSSKDELHKTSGYKGDTDEFKDIFNEQDRPYRIVLSLFSVITLIISTFTILINWGL